MTDEQRPSAGRRAGSRRADRPTATAGRRGAAGRRRVDVLVALGIALPAVVAGALSLTAGDEPPGIPPEAPVRAVLHDASLVCPAAPGRSAGVVLAGRAPGLDDAEVTVLTADDDAAVALTEVAPVDVGPERLAEVDSDADVVLNGEGDAAPGLLAGRAGEAESAGECRPAAFDEWFTGLGAAARQSSTIELVNPEAAPAVVEIDLHGRGGPVEEEDLHGIRVPGSGVVRLDLSEVAPRRGPLAAHVVVARGRVVTTVRHTFDPLGRSRPRVDFVPAQAEPATETVLLGVPARASGSVYLANPGDDEARATVRVVSEEATFTPAGLEEVAVPPGTVRAVPLPQVLTPEARDGVVGLQVQSSSPLLATARLLHDDDPGFVGPALALADDEPVPAVVPAGSKRLVLGGALRAGVVRVSAADADGEPLLEEERFEIGADHGVAIDLPDEAVLVTVDPRNTPVSATVELTGARTGTLRLRPPEVYAEVPAVRPG